MRSVLVGLLVLFGITFSAQSQAAPCHPAEFFVTDTTDPLFETQADVTITLGGVAVTGSTPLDGVYWSATAQRLSYERSREFHLCADDPSTLRSAAEALRRTFGQESVLSFDYQAPDPNAVLIAVPDVDITRLGAALTADPTARTRLRGGSVTATDHTLILVADRADRELAHRLVSAAGGDWNTAEIVYGTREFVE
jgi:hypothetical protein